ncbi:MAG: TPM domain-containing protein, partial [Vulcanococcus sp.]
MTGSRGVLARIARALLSLVLLLVVWVAPARAFDNPDLLPDHPTPVIDLAK